MQTISVLRMTELKERILTEAECLFCHYGIKSITMDDIAKHLGISKKTIYQHFSDKNELVRIQIKNMMDRQQCLLNNNTDAAENPVHEVFLAVTHIQVLLSKMNPALFYDLQKYHPEAWQEFKNFRDKYLLECIQSNLKRGIEEGYYREEIDINILSRLRVQQIDMIFNKQAFPAAEFNLSEVMRLITEHFLYGICNSEGNKLIYKYKHINEEE